MNKKLDRNFYDALELDRNADADTIKKGFRKMALIHHPDKGGTDENFQKINEAWTILQDPVKRADYDRDLKKFNLKDGIKRRGTMGANDLKFGAEKAAKEAAASKANDQFNRGQTMKEEEAKFQKKSTYVEIPPNLATLSIKELKNVLVQLGLTADDCFEKTDLIQRIKDHREGKRKPERRNSEMPSEPKNFGANNKENSKPAPSQKPSSTNF